MGIEQIEVVIKSIGNTASSIMAIITLSVFIIPKFKNMLAGWFTKTLGINGITEKLDKHIEKDKDKQALAEQRDEVILDISKKLNEYIEESKENKENQYEFNKFQFRENLNRIYFEYMPKGKVPANVKENLVKGYDIYKNTMNGNSYASQYVKELINLPVEF